MNNTRIPISDTGLFSKLICDFVDGDSKLKMFLDSFVSLESIQNKIHNKGIVDRKTLVSTIKNQYGKTNFLNANLSFVQTNISKLLDEKSYTITTGHQLNIFLSPLFLIYKIISVISATEYLNQELRDYHFVPCFWMATDDHDFEEIKSCTINNNKYSWDIDPYDAVGNLESKSILSVLDSLKKILIQTSHGQELYNIYLYAYENNLNYADATRSILTSLFSDYGLVIIDGNQKELKNIFSQHFKDEITYGFTSNMISRTNDILSKNYQPEINSMESNIFYLSNSIRSKIKNSQQKYFTDLHDFNWSQEELLEHIDNFQAKFNTLKFIQWYTLFSFTFISSFS